MKWFDYISTFYHKLLRVGVTEDLSFSEKLRTELCNQFIVIAFPTALFHLVYNFLTVNQFRGYLLVSIWCMVLSITLLLNHYKKYLLARIFIIMVSLSVIAACHVLFGWEQRLDVMYLVFALIACYILERKFAILIITLISLTYIGVAVYLQNFGPIFKIEIIGSGPFAYFAFALLLTIALTAKLLRENYRFNQLTIRQNKILEAQNKELERFTYVASHDLKSPLSNIIGLSEFIEEDLKAGDCSTALQHLAFVQTSSQRMSYLIEDILELSKIRKDSKANRKVIDLNQIVETSKQMLAQEIQEKNASIVCQDLISYHCNETEFTLLFQNLIQNGIKYNKNPHPKVEIWSSSNEKHNTHSIHFKDNGIGIHPSNHHLIFDYFKRLHNQTEYEGTGIGLGLCKKIIQKYDGTIHLQSIPNQGSVFTVEIPRVTVGELMASV